MSRTDVIADTILGGAFWLMLGIVAVIFGKGLFKKLVDRLAVETPGGGKVSAMDGALFDMLFSLGQSRGPRQIGDFAEEKATLGMRFGIPALFVVAAYSYFSSVPVPERVLVLELAVYGLFVAYMAFIWAYSLRYDREKLLVRGWLLTFREYDLTRLESITVRGNGTYHLWFDDGRKAEVLRHITNSRRFHSDMP